MIVVNLKFQEGRYPSADSRLVIRTEEVCWIRLVLQLESISPRVDVLIRNNAIVDGVDMTLNFGLLKGQRLWETMHTKTTEHLQIHCCS